MTKAKKWRNSWKMQWRKSDENIEITKNKRNRNDENKENYNSMEIKNDETNRYGQRWRKWKKI